LKRKKTRNATSDIGDGKKKETGTQERRGAPAGQGAAKGRGNSGERKNGGNLKGIKETQISAPDYWGKGRRDSEGRKRERRT